MFVGDARVSTQDQNPQLQLDALKAAGCERSFVERASGAQRERSKLQGALEYMREGDTLVVRKLDRLARSLKQLVETVKCLETGKIGFRSLTEDIDTTTPGDRQTFDLFAALAEFERSIIKERTTAGLAAARAQRRPAAVTECQRPDGSQGAAERSRNHRRGSSKAVEGVARHALPPFARWPGSGEGRDDMMAFALTLEARNAVISGMATRKAHASSS